MSRKVSEVFESIRPVKDLHASYFETLQNKLLQESDKLTAFIDQSPSSHNYHKGFRKIISPAKIQPPTPLSLRLSNKIEQPRNNTPPFEKVKKICEKMKALGIETEPLNRPLSEHLTKEHYQNHRQVVYNVCGSKEGLGKQQLLNIATEKERIQRIKRSLRILSDSQSLKDTISTQSCKSLRITSEQAIPFLNQGKIKLEDFQIMQELGKGRIGQVSLVRHRKTNFCCALKRIPQALLCADSKMLVQRIREIKIQSFLDHPNVVQLYSVFVEEGNLYLLMQFCSDGDLYQNLRRSGPFPEQRIRSVIKQICHAVEYMHDNDILHRDLKPENILFHENIVKICDFGWAVNSPLLRDTYCGSPVYTSPELAQNQQYDNKVDIWNIGILTYQLAYGRVPFEIRSQEEVLKVVEEDIYFPRSKPASPDIKDFIMRCLSKKPKERYSISKLIDHQFLNPFTDHPRQV